MAAADDGRRLAICGDSCRAWRRWWSARPPISYAGQINALLNRPDALPVLPTIDVPTLLLSGTEDAWSPVSQHETMRRRIPHATLFEIHGAGHMAPFERPEAVAVALREWLALIENNGRSG